MYDSTNDFTLQLRGLLKQSDLHVISSLIKKMESSLSHCRLYAKLISTIVVRNEDDNLSQLFDCLTLSLVRLYLILFEVYLILSGCHLSRTN